MTKNRINALTAVAVALFALASPLSAQRAKNPPQAFALVQAPEAVVEVCLAASVQAAIECARKRCHRKAGQGACFAVTACEPMGWAGLMGVQLTELHFSSGICGAPSREALMVSLKAFCDGQVGAKQCNVTNLWSPDGKQHPVGASWTPADAKPADSNKAGSNKVDSNAGGAK